MILAEGAVSALRVRRDSDRKILLTTLAPKNFFNKTVMTFRRKEILTFEPSKVERQYFPSAWTSRPSC